jgi:hypothetical protein
MQRFLLWCRWLQAPLQASAIGTSGDLVCQLAVEGKTLSRIDTRRSLSFSIFGFLYSGSECCSRAPHFVTYSLLMCEPHCWQYSSAHSTCGSTKSLASGRTCARCRSRWRPTPCCTGRSCTSPRSASAPPCYRAAARRRCGRGSARTGHRWCRHTSEYGQPRWASCSTPSPSLAVSYTFRPSRLRRRWSYRRCHFDLRLLSCPSTCVMLVTT